MLLRSYRQSRPKMCRLAQGASVVLLVHAGGHFVELSFEPPEQAQARPRPGRRIRRESAFIISEVGESSGLVCMCFLLSFIRCTND